MSVAWNFELVRFWSIQSAFMLLLITRLMNVENSTNFHIIFRDKTQIFPAVMNLKQ